MDWPAAQRQPLSFRNWISWSLLLILILLATIAAGWHRTLIGTEVWAIYIAGQPLSVQLAEVRNDLVHPPLIYLVQRAWMATFGQTDSVARALPIFIAIPSMLLLPLLAARITPHWRLLSFFLACVFFQVGSAGVQTRMYGLALFWTIAAMLLWDMWRENPRTRTLVAWTAVATFLVYTHLFGGLLLGAFVLVNWIFGPRKMAFTLFAAVPVLAFIPWILYVLPVYQARGLASNLGWAHQSLLGAIPALFSGYLGGYLFESYRPRFIFTAMSAVIYLELLILLWFNRKRFWPLRASAEETGLTQRWFWSAVILSGAPLLALFTFSLVVSRAFEGRFVYGVIMPFVIALFLMCQLSGRAGRIVLLCLLLPWRVGSIANSIYFFSQPTPVRMGVEFVAPRVQAGDLLLVEHPGYSNIVYWEWNRRLLRSERIATLPAAADQPLLMSIVKPSPFEQMDLTGIRRIWVFQFQTEFKPELAQALAARGFSPVPRGASGIPRLSLFERKMDR